MQSRRSLVDHRRDERGQALGHDEACYGEARDDLIGGPVGEPLLGRVLTLGGEREALPIGTGLLMDSAG